MSVQCWTSMVLNIFNCFVFFGLNFLHCRIACEKRECCRFSWWSAIIHFVVLSDEDVNERVVKMRARGVKRHERYVKISQRDILKIEWVRFENARTSATVRENLVH